MKLSDLCFDYPEHLVATEPASSSRVMWVSSILPEPEEINLTELLKRIPAGDVLVINDTKVLKRRVFVQDLEILFLQKVTEAEAFADSNSMIEPLKTTQDHSRPEEQPRPEAEYWEVLFPSKRMAVGEFIHLPDGHQVQLVRKGRPQVLRSARPLTQDFFQSFAELPLPPYIQKSRNQRHTNSSDESWYQTAWAQNPGSLAAPTASLHFTENQIHLLEARGVKVIRLTLHVGLGTFLPVTVEDLDQHEMHSELMHIKKLAWNEILKAKNDGKKIWAMGTTATRALESAACGMIPKNEGDDFFGHTNLLIQPGYNWQIVDRLLTNFHQPQSTLLALVSAFSDLATVKKNYQWAIEKNFRLFSYGDLSVWIR